MDRGKEGPEQNHQDSGNGSCLEARGQSWWQERCEGMNWCSQVISTSS